MRCARRSVWPSATDGPWTVDEAAYVAFAGKRPLVPVVGPAPPMPDAVLAAARTRVVDIVDGIERGEFPPQAVRSAHLQLLRVPVGVPEGLRWRRVTPAAVRRTPTTVDARIAARDRAARARAVDPRFNVALEASAGTGKTRVLVDRYVNLLRAGVDPSNILAITFTRKAAAEMRERIMATLRRPRPRGEIPPARWRELRDRTADIAISTIDAFCLSLLREFPLEADLDPGFSVADETELPRLVDEALDRTLRICRAAARDDEHVALVFAQLGERRARAGLAALLESADRGARRAARSTSPRRRRRPGCRRPRAGARRPR